MLYANYMRNKMKHLEQIVKVPATGTQAPPLTLENSKGKPLKDYKIFGKGVQNGTPSPSNPIEPKFVGDLVTDASSEYYGKYKAIARMYDSDYWGCVDLGSLNYNYQRPTTTYPYGYFSADISEKKAGKTNFNSSLYQVIQGFTEDKSMCGSWNTSKVYFMNSDYSDTTTFKSAMSGVYIYYEKAIAQGTLPQPTETPIYLDSPIRGVNSVVDSVGLKSGRVDYIEALSYPEVTKASLVVNTVGSIVINIRTCGKAYGDYTKKILCNCLIGSTYTSQDGYAFLSNNALLSLRTGDSSVVDVNTAYDWIQNHEFKCVYVKSNSTTTPITLPSIPTIKGDCILEIVSEVQPSSMEVKYVK